jgi:hypothetical protein
MNTHSFPRAFLVVVILYHTMAELSVDRYTSKIGEDPPSVYEDVQPVSDVEHEDEEDSIASGDETAVKPWDEGGQSDCGYSDAVHDTLMSVGQSVHDVTGDSHQEVLGVQHLIGNWFQELSYAVRDIVRGENKTGMHEDATAALNTILTGGADDEKKENQGPETPESKGVVQSSDV